MSSHVLIMGDEETANLVADFNEGRFSLRATLVADAVTATLRLGRMHPEELAMLGLKIVQVANAMRKTT